MEFIMLPYPDSQTALAADTSWLDAGDLSAMVRAVAAERCRAEQGQDEARACNERGMERRRDGDLQGALREFDAALGLQPGLAVAYNNRGATRYELGDLDGALADFEEALRLDPLYADAYGNRAAARAEQGDDRGAAADCRRALELAPGSASLHARRGALLHKQKNWLAARADYDHALRLDAGLHWVYLLRGNTYYHTGDWHALWADYRRGFALAPSRCAGLVVRHLLSALRSDAAAALGMAEEHVQQDPDNPVARAHRGLLLLLLRREAEAEADLAFCQARCAAIGRYLELIHEQVAKRVPR
jgi:tetratricopeptide (TPR) repeat protein